MGVGLAQGCYDLASAYAKERVQFGQPIAAFQAVQQKLVDIATELEAARCLVYKAAWEKDQGRDFARTAAMAKLFSGELSHRAANWALQIHGGYGFMDEYPISRLYRDQKILEIGEGTNEVQRMVIARHLGLLTRVSGLLVRRVLFRQFVDDDLGCGSYLVGDPDAGEAVVVDPAFAIEPYLDGRRARPACGSCACSRRTPTPTTSRATAASRSSTACPSRSTRSREPEYPFDALADGQTIRVGVGRDRRRHTPGHRPEHCAFVVDGELVLTGDSMFVGEAARPDLAIEAREGAADLWHSLRRLAELPDATRRLSRATSRARSAART